MPESPTPVVPTHRLRELVAPPVVVQAAELPLYFARLNPGARGEFWQLNHAPNAWLRFEAEVLGPARLGALAWARIAPRPEPEAVPAHLTAIQEGPDPFWIVQSNWVARLVTFAPPEAKHGEEHSD
jgi:hypothetical protein